LPLIKTYNDLDLDFSAHPNTGNISTKKDADAVVRSVRNLLLMNHFDKPFHPEVGSNITRHLFEPMTVATTLRLETDIKNVINNFEPRVRLSEVRVQAVESENGYKISLTFFIVNEEVERQTVFFLERYR
tara:strand:- start:57 stop:446 length:390 start_codon:yes stop_codon:yes gene_type:complete